jgi:cation diffusion facilitator family transporter
MDASTLKQRAALASVFASASLALLKLLAGLLSGSLALISEGGHGALDTAASVMTYVAVRVADKPADEDHPFGHAKVEAVAALAETGLLAMLALVVAYEAILRLMEPPPVVDATTLAFAVLIISMIVDLTRWRGLAKIARDTSSDALAADALHYSSDLVSSFLVLVGLALTHFGFQRADSVAAIGVAIFIAIAGYRLGRRTIDALVDTAPRGFAAQLRTLIARAPGVAAVDFVRVRPSGAQIIGDVGLSVSRTLPLEQVAAIKDKVIEAIAARFPEAALTVVANPLALDDESLLESVLLIAARRRLAVHHVIVQEIGGRKCVSLDMEVDGRMSLGEAHDHATRLETAIQKEVGADIEVETHIEPMETNEIRGHDADTATLEAIGAALVAAAGKGRLRQVHNVRARVTDAGLVVNFHCRIDPGISVDATHEEVDAVERALRVSVPNIMRVIGHAEPLPTSH